MTKQYKTCMALFNISQEKKMVPQDLKFTETHEWVKLEDDSDLATVGISTFASEHIGDVVFLELPAVGDAVKQGDTFGVIESVKAAFDLNSPVSGEVLEINESIIGDFDKLAQDPYGAGWMFKVNTSNSGELNSLMDSKQYEEFLKTVEG